jgi:diguanylate cyclase (GGDEF)-like protein
MLMLDSAPRRADRAGSGARASRMTLARRPGEVPPEQLLGRRAFAQAPWVVVSLVSLALAVSQVCRDHDASFDALLFGGAIASAVVTGVLALIQDRPIGVRLRGSLWVYLLGSAVVLALLALCAVRDAGVSSVYFAAVCPLAIYLGLVIPEAWRWPVALTLFATTLAVQLVTPAPSWFDAGVVWTLILGSWCAGLLVSTGHARVAKIARRLSSYDRLTGSLNRRGFMRQLERALVDDGSPDGPIALLMLDLDGFRARSDESEARANDLLAWVGATLSSVLPPRAQLGRLGNDDFAILLPGASRRSVEAIIADIHDVLRPQTAVSIGAATSETRDLDAPDLFRVADAARVMATREATGSHLLVAGTLRTAPTAAARAIGTVLDPPLSYAQIRATGKLPRLVAADEMNGRIISLGLAVVAAAGVPVVARGLLGYGDGVAADVVRYGGIPWLVWAAALAMFSWNRAGKGGWVDVFLLVNNGLAISAGVAVVALSGGGLTSPMIAAYFVKTLFDASVAPRAKASFSVTVMLAGWAAVALLSDPSVLWVMPFQGAMFAGCFVLGALGRHAMEQTGLHAISRAHTDDLTQLANRAAFRRQAEDSFFTAATTTGDPFALIAFRIEGLRAFNETLGYAAGDALLRDIADLLSDRLPTAYTIGRIGAAEFLAAVPASAGGARELAIGLGDSIRSVIGVSVSTAACPEDGATIPTLMLAAERRLRTQHSIAA